MTTIIFDTLDFSKRAMEAGFTREQAEFQAREAANAIEYKLASKDDLTRETSGIRGDLNRETSSIRKDISSLREEVAKEFKAFENRMTIKFGAMMVTAVGILLAFKFFHIT